MSAINARVNFCKATSALVTIWLAQSLAVAQVTQSDFMQYEYDAEGNLTRTTNSLGHATSQAWDSLGRITQQNLPPTSAGTTGPKITFEHDQLDQLIKVTDPRNLVTTYQVNGLGDRSLISSPDTGTTSYATDAAGNVIQAKDARGQTTIYTYDSLNRVVSATYGSGTPSTFEYDTGSPGAIGRISKMKDESGQTAFRYDDQGRLLSKEQATGDRLLMLSYEYGTSGSALGKIISLRYPSGNQIRYDYDELGQITALTLVTVNGQTVPLLQEIRYLPFGPVASWTWGAATIGNARQYVRTFDIKGRIVGYDLGSGLFRTLEYNATDQIVRMRHFNRLQQNSALLQLDQQFEYDTLGRLTRHYGPTTIQSYRYDDNNNRITSVFGAATYTNLYFSNSNRLQLSTGPSATNPHLYDATGNLTRDRNMTFSYNGHGRMSTSTTRLGVVSYYYNGLGERVLKKIPVSARGLREELSFIYEPDSAKLLGEYELHSNSGQETVYLGNIPVAAMLSASASKPPIVYYVYADQIDAPRVLIKAATGQVAWRWDTADPFGLDSPNNVWQGETLTYNLRFPGQYYDRETNLHYNYFRDYDPEIGRYIQSDPIGLVGGLNSYIYVNGDPVASADPLGLQRLPSRVEMHNSWVNPNRQMLREFGSEIWPGPNAPWPRIPQNAKPWCRLECPSDTPLSCPGRTPVGIAKISSSGERCVEVCIQGPFAVSVESADIPSPADVNWPRSATPMDGARLYGILRTR